MIGHGHIAIGAFHRLSAIAAGDKIGIPPAVDEQHALLSPGQAILHGGTQAGDIFRSVKVEVGGYGICWGENLCISREKLYTVGKKIPLTWSEIQSFVSNSTLDSAQAAAELECSKQNIDDLVKRGKLHPVKEGQRYRLFMKSEVEERRWK